MIVSPDNRYADLLRALIKGLFTMKNVVVRRVIRQMALMPFIRQYVFPPPNPKTPPNPKISPNPKTPPNPKTLLTRHRLA
jgi:hypothetical protein